MNAFTIAILPGCPHERSDEAMGRYHHSTGPRGSSLSASPS